MGWFWPQSRPECTSTTEEVRAGVRDLLQDDPALQMFVSESCLKRFVARLYPTTLKSGKYVIVQHHRVSLAIFTYRKMFKSSVAQPPAKYHPCILTQSISCTVSH